jgi:ADP-heptose:LPS heptosyltransferase
VDLVQSIYKQWLRAKMKRILPNQPPETVDDIWIVFLQMLGDLLLISPLPRLIKAKWPNAKLTMVCDQKFRDVWRYNSFIDRIIEIKGIPSRRHHGLAHDYRQINAIAKDGRREGVDLMFEMDHTYYGIYLGMLTRPQWGVGFEYKRIGEKHWSVNFRDSFMNRTELYMRMAGAAELDVKEWKQEIYWPAESNEKADQLLYSIKRGKRLKIGLAPWTSHRSKDWPLNQIIDFCELAATNDLDLVLLGTKSNQKEADYVMEHTYHSPLNLVGQTSILELAAVTKQLDAVVGCDSGIAHLAATLDKPLVELMSYNNPETWRPFGQRVKILKKEICVQDCNPFLCNDIRCMMFEAEEVLDELKLIINYNFS